MPFVNGGGIEKKSQLVSQKMRNSTGMKGSSPKALALGMVTQATIATGT